VLIAAILFGISPAVSMGADTITAGEIEHFEHTWESWTRNIVNGIHPGLALTVIARMDFSQNPGQLEAYEEMKAANHLPGLPEMNDPNYTRPLDSPLYALIAKKHIRVIFHQTIPAGEKTLIDEVIRAKLKINSTDNFNSEIISVNQRPPKEYPKTAIALLSVLFMVGIGALAWLRSKNQPEDTANTKIRSGKSAPLVPVEKPAVAETPIPSTYQILNSEPSIRRLALAREKTDTIAKASLNCSTRFSNQLLGELDQDKFDLVNQWLLKNPRIVTLAESNYARLLLSARIQQVENQKIISAISSLKTRQKTQEKSA
ncbi:MAG: hypothetical protein KGP28_04805, partial [Bdellovibrionales bacterium]|nr:hypothetical protein [Bdellovibrionales bacterium]